MQDCRLNLIQLILNRMATQVLTRLLRIAACSTFACGAVPVFAQTDLEGLTCLSPPFEAAPTEQEQKVRSLVVWLRSALGEFDSLIEILDDPSLEVCLGERLFGIQGYFEVGSRRIVLRADLEPGLMRAVAIHELRHAQQDSMGICLHPDLSMQSSARLVLAMEADASAIGAGIAWVLRQSGEPEVWDALADWPGQSSVVQAFEDEIADSGDFARATTAAFARWYEVDDLREVYYRAACSAYLDRQDQTHAIAGYDSVDDAAFRALCRLPTGDAYDCQEPDLE
ncbi:hypothetical protein JQU17_11180 [Ponticoccus sp. SC2-23]|uniref:DUF6782 family putative metallopeptidase n=1 Tax=Alexandriicola marinus TaxID=2081710 RepID=UPI000FDB0892|nr:DUF6782 family putative metallopeptidase [Alexandriicola marinus]MBM1221455.1 hypothetical protein [Ponticoccus sp. SC6-9]MBM1226496.1 hypothetical protein [Ponticoccus sp. SC6-15]MBM1230447.1 hypothetical protein [Ponticoccus sp. SC6-38]MBM1234970.1 hypothetical protein [Ponticoccus sp. SC6-45]MBM1239468.1 hypothetical protein [Ponticoccus sp. SC6-49]MBM1243250.1 hypothetical protein [Ponticoccus sp. SC2-64]MBM1248494.1 hypothetical protein [Ponticoccus sp. SC6-42]MBM1253079.1 hypotheti